MRIAIASSGLGHVARGIETWALDTADALHRLGEDVTLFAAAEAPSSCPLVVLPCVRRRTATSNILVKLTPGFAWRWGLKNGYGWEQLTFWRHLRRRLKEGGYDILHVQDPMVAWWCRRERKAGRIRTREILAHGTEEPLDFLAQFDYVQHLAPWHLEQSVLKLREKKACWCALPNFVDTEAYRPASSTTEKRKTRLELGIPENAFVVGTAAAIKKGHKRIDYLIREFAEFSRRWTRRSADCGDEATIPFLVVAGSEQEDTAELRALAKNLCSGRVKFLVDYPHPRMPELLRCHDVFVLTSLFEMMPIALLEAIASGLPAILNRHPVLEWMGGSGGIFVDMSSENSLASTLDKTTAEEFSRFGRQAREHAVAEFSRESVVASYVEYYGRIAPFQTVNGKAGISPALDSQP